MSPDSTIRPAPSDLERQVMFELAVALGECIESEGCTLDTGPETFKVFTDLFAETVGKGLAKNPNLWNAKGRAYVIKQIRKIAFCATSAAKETPRCIVTAQILEECARERITKEMHYCQYAATVARSNPNWKDVPWGDFCPTGIG